jgi:ATP-dependent helicase HrpB
MDSAREPEPPGPPSQASLPIDGHLERIAADLSRHGSLVLVAEPGAGKTTRVPPGLVARGLAGSRGQVVVLQPRRLAARTAAARIAEEHGDGLGGFAGYQVRFDSRVSARTRVRVITEGILTRELQQDPSLPGVAAVVLDEFHERSLHADLALALCREVQRTLRPDLKILVMSATLEAQGLRDFLGNAPLVEVQGRVFPSTVVHCEFDEQRPLPVRVAAAVRRALAEGDGDVLAFLPGVGEILRTQAELAGPARAQDWLVLPLYGELDFAEQDRALAPSPRRKVILATNVAETSLTVPGVRAVVDSGLARSASHDPGRGLDRLELVPISRASAVQRAGRAGRTAPGRVYRLWNPAADNLRRAHDLPEVRRVDLAGCALELFVWGERDLARFGWFEAPEAAALERAERLLARLGAIDRDSRAVTPLGRVMARIPAHPRLAKLLAAGAAEGLLPEAARFAALLSERDIVRRVAGPSAHRTPRGRIAAGSSDLLARADLVAGNDHGSGVEVDRNVLRNVERLERQLERATERASPGPNPAGTGPGDGLDLEESLLRLVLGAYPDRVAALDSPAGRTGRMQGGQGILLSEESALDGEPLFVVLDADLGARGQQGERARARVRQASAIRREWLAELTPGALRVESAAGWDSSRERVVATRRTLYEDLVLDEVETSDLDPHAAVRRVLEEAAKDPARALAPGEHVERLLSRIASLAGWMPELELPALDLASLVLLLEPWCQGVVSFQGLRAVSLVDVIESQLDSKQRAALAKHAPESLETPAGTTRRLEYAPGKPPVLSVRLQELFGLAETPSVAGGRVHVLLHLLAPNHRVVQVTDDLSSFWNTTYAQVRKDLRGRYPKHSWPEDPWNAPPTARAKRRGT